MMASRQPQEEEGGGGGGGGGESNSLFEGMVLFTPSHAPDAEPPPHHHAAPPPSSQEQQQQQPPPPLPLDEDLFSDLTLLPLHPQPPPHQDRDQDQQPPLPLPHTGISRQPSLSSSSTFRKKKRAVRVGFARSPDLNSSPSPLTSADTNATTNENANTITSTAAAFADPTPPPPLPPPKQEGEEEQQQYETGDEDAAVAIGAEQAGEDKDKDKEEEGGVGIGIGIGIGIEERLGVIRCRISRNLESIRERAASVGARRKLVGGRRRKVAEEVSSASWRHKELERELEEACESEDFESAERISESLEGLERERERLLVASRDAQLDYDSVDLEMQQLLHSLIAAEDEAAALLEHLAKDASDYADTVSKQTEETYSKEIEGWQASMELLEVKKLEMEVEAQLVLAARSGLEGSIEHLVEDDKREKDMLRKKGDTLAEELARLLELVRLKEAEIAENTARIQEVEHRISAVVSEFHGSQSDIDLKLNNLQAAQSKMDTETEALLMKKKGIDELISLMEQNNSEIREIASTCSSEAKACKDSAGGRRNLASSILKSRQDRVLLLNAEEKILEDVQMLRLQTSEGRTSLQELSSRRAGIQQEMALFKQRLSFIDRRGPELEAEKKVAAAARNFKEAGRIAAEAKALNVEMEELHAKLEKAAIDLEKIEKEIAATADKIQECEVLISHKEKESAVASYKRLRLVAAAARAERTAAIEMGDSEEGELLLKEAESAEAKARELKECYDLQTEEDENMFQPALSVAFITNLTGQRLAEIAASLSSSSQK